jgi:hypothetical protein
VRRLTSDFEDSSWCGIAGLRDCREVRAELCVRMKEGGRKDILDIVKYITCERRVVANVC